MYDYVTNTDFYCYNKNNYYNYYYYYFSPFEADCFLLHRAFLFEMYKMLPS